MKNLVKRCSPGCYVLVLGVLVLLLGGWLANQYQTRLNTPIPIEQASHFTLQPGQGLRSLSRHMVAEGWAENAWMLELYGRRQGLAPRLQAGEYAVQPGMTPRMLLHAIARGEVVQHRVTIPEGWTLAQALRHLRQHPELRPPPESVGPDNLIEILGLEGLQDFEHAEGWFLADTYFFGSGTEALEVLRRAHRAMQAALERAWAMRHEDHPAQSPYELLILASIIERETGRSEERSRVAGVFTNRLQQGMRLQTDPTLLYVQEPGVQRLTRAELQRDHPFNTYTRAGLPPTPIALPGRAALEAAAQPADTQDLFFVSRGDGSHHFSETYREHREAVIHYQLGGDGSRYGIRRSDP